MVRRLTGACVAAWTALLVAGPPNPSITARAQTRQRTLDCPAPGPPPARLPAPAQEKLARSFQAARRHARHVWRDTPPVNADGTVNVFVEIAPGTDEKWEFDMAANRRELDRRIPATLDGYPVGYGFVPRTVNVDGDPFDGLVLGEDVEAGAIVRGHVLGLMHMTDEKGSDEKVIVTAEPREDVRRTLLDDRMRERIATFFNRYKAEDEDAETFACVSGWSDADAGRRFVEAASRLFVKGRAGRGPHGQLGSPAGAPRRRPAAATASSTAISPALARHA